MLIHIYILRYKPADSGSLDGSQRRCSSSPLLPINRITYLCTFSNDQLAMMHKEHTNVYWQNQSTSPLGMRACQIICLWNHNNSLMNQGPSIFIMQPATVISKYLSTPAPFYRLFTPVHSLLFYFSIGSWRDHLSTKPNNLPSEPVYATNHHSTEPATVTTKCLVIIGWQ